MDFLKFKLATARHSGKQRRFGYCQPTGDLGKPELTGILPSSYDFDLGAPNLKRNENFSLICSNSQTNRRLMLNLKWRPLWSKSTEGDVTNLLTSFKITIKDKLYSYRHIEAYKPQPSTIRPGRQLQYGSKRAHLKIIILSPYRRLRLLFRGHMKPEGGGESIFVKINFLIVPTSATFDFLEQYNPDCFREGYSLAKKPLSRGYSDALTDLIFHDCHEFTCRVAGDLTFQLSEQKMGSPLTKETVYFWGFLSREFMVNNLSEQGSFKWTRLQCSISNGQIFDIAYKERDGDKLCSGYTCFSNSALTMPIEHPFAIDTEDLNESTSTFKATVFGEAQSFDLEAIRKDNGYFELQFNGKPGWAYLNVCEQPKDDQEFAEEMAKLDADFLRGLEDGAILRAPSSAENSEKLVVSTEDPECCSSDLVGSKAASLAQLKKLELSMKRDKSEYHVPHAFVLTKNSFNWIDSETTTEQQELQTIVASGRELHKLKEFCEALQRSVEGKKLHHRVLSDLETKLTEKYGQERVREMRFAVRSSSWGEDEEGMSAAGQLTTVLGVRGTSEDLSAAIMSCFASKFSHANIEYKRQHGLSLNLPMAVVIQEMVNCDKAGVMFTCEPTSADQSLLLITANYGLGESVVSGQADPDSIKVRCRSLDEQETEFQIEESNVGAKSTVIDDQSLAGGQARQYDRSRCCLSPEEIQRLARCGLKLSNYYQNHMDIEWGFKGGQLYLLQARPITGLDNFSDFELRHEADSSSRAETNYLSRANVGEVVPFASKPFTMTFFLYHWNVQGVRIYSKFIASDIYRCTTIPNEVHYDSYHTFFSLRTSALFRHDYDINDPNSPKAQLAQAMQVSFFGHPLDEIEEIREAAKGILMVEDIFFGFKYQIHTFWLRKRPIQTILKQKHLMQWLRQQIKDKKLATGYEKNKLQGLSNQLKNVMKYNYHCWENHIFIIRMGGATNMELTMMLSRYIHDKNKLYSTSAKFFAAAPNVISAEIPKRIERITQLIRENSSSSEELNNFANKWSTEECLEYINKKNPVKAEYSEFIKKFGHRNYDEFNLASDPWGTDQSKVIDMIKKSCAIEKAQNFRQKETSVENILSGLEKELGVQIEPRIRTYMLNDLVPRVHTYVAAREHTKDILIEHTDLLRIASKELARELQLQMRLPDEDLFFYLFYDELEPLVREPQPAIVMHAIRRRNMFKQFDKPWIYDEIIRGCEPTPNHLKPNKELEEKVAKAPKLFGTPASSGKVQGKICLVEGYSQISRVRAGDILLTHSTDIAFSPIFPLIKGIITEVGGLISHGAVVAREYGLPSLLGIPDVTRIIKDGEEVILDADNGVIIRLDLTSNELLQLQK